MCVLRVCPTWAAKPLKRNRRYAYYRCAGNNAFRLAANVSAKTKQVHRDKLDEVVWNDASDLLHHPTLLRKEYERRLASPETSDGELALKRQVRSAQATVNRLIDAFSDGVLNRDEFEPRVQRAPEEAVRPANAPRRFTVHRPANKPTYAKPWRAWTVSRNLSMSDLTKQTSTPDERFSAP